ncbi:MAG: gliding motility-associated C-terminal domain-containing protein [Bacteroidia bacterium]|nr:gliding motility-associated C-terminal domain-containing protein [Bacteroidia bacterium]
MLTGNPYLTCNLRFVFALLAGIVSLTPNAWATHNLAGQITAQRNDPNNSNSYEITLTTYTDPAPAGVDRCSADIEIWSVSNPPLLLATLTQVPRANGGNLVNVPSDCTIPNPKAGVVVKGTVKRNLYYVSYIFPGPGEYEIRYQDIARHGSVNNITSPEEVSFYVFTRIFITPPIIGSNNTPLLLNEPLDDACLGKIWTHNPGGFDPDGDSLSYYLKESYQYDPPNPPTIANGYRFPDDPSFGNSTFTMDPVTGIVTWDVPLKEGIFNFAYVVEEWRNGQLLGFVVRDMAIWVIDCDNNPPVIETINDTCVYAGDVLEFDFLAYDPDEGDSLYLELNNGIIGNNGPFSVSNTATVGGLVVDPVPGNSFTYNDLPVSTLNNVGLVVDTIKGTIRWETECDNIRKQFYQVDFYATDNKSYSSPNSLSTTLSANKAVSIRVIPPPPTELSVTKGSRSVTLNWLPTFCEDKVLGYNVYRRVGSPGWMEDTVCCEVSPSEAGFTLISYNKGWLSTQWVDSLTDLEGIFGKDICYVVTAIYDVPSEPLIPALESCATNEVCIEILNDELYMTNDSVSVTDAVNGSIFVSWSLPVIDEFFPAPYAYHLYRANNNGFPAIKIANLNYNDTTYIDTGIDTDIRGYNYRVELFDGLGLLVNTSNGKNIGSSIYLTVAGTGSNSMDLSWTEFVPWMNQEYEIHRSENGGPFLLITTVPGTGANTHTYQDLNLNPSIEYCYFIRSTGSHQVPGIKDPLINDSQVACDFAQDDEPPCPPDISVSGNCLEISHEVIVSKPLLSCDDDGEYISILFANNPAGPYREVSRLPFGSFSLDTTLLFTFNNDLNAYAGCYAVTATDTLGNTSPLSEPFCIDYCPDLVMANVFSPNGDGINDIFKPKFYRDVILKEFKVFDRWGRLMHTSTTDIGVLWQGEAFDGKAAKEGVYYYYIRYEELGLGGNTPGERTGWVTLMR